MKRIIIDTNIIVGSFDEARPEFAACSAIVDNPEYGLVLSPLVIAEVDYLLYTKLGSRAAQDFATDVAAGVYALADWTPSDHAEARPILNRSTIDSEYVGITDASLVVLADRYRTTTIATLDQRHFRQLKPIWGADHFTLYPADL